MGGCSGSHDIAIGDNDMGGGIGLGDGLVVQVWSHLVEVSSGATVSFEIEKRRGGHRIARVKSKCGFT